MVSRFKYQRIMKLVFMMVATIIWTLALRSQAAAQYVQKNLVSDLPDLAARTDSNLINPWGITYPPTGPFWISDNGTGLSALYYGTGRPFPKSNSQIIVSIPPPAGSPAGTTATPTGVIFNGTTDFVVSENSNSGAARFIFATEDGTISGWNPGVDFANAILAVDDSANAADGFGLGAVFKGVATGNDGTGNFLYVTNFRDGVVEMYDASFHFVKAFTDPSIVPDATSPGFAPFGIRNVGGSLYVTFAMQDEFRHDDVKGLGNGFIDVFDLDGNLVGQFTTGGTLNSPWGLALAPANFGPFSNALLVGNFGDGHINAFAPGTGDFLGQLPDNHGNPIAIDGLWGLMFGNGALAGPTNILFFTAGINSESDGLFGQIQFGN